MSLVYLRSYNTEKGKMVACCDDDLMGRTYREGRLKLSLDKGFFGESLFNIGEALVLLDGADILNLVGCRVVKAAIERGLVHPDAVISIDGVLHVQVMRV